MKVFKCPKSGAIHCVEDTTGYGEWEELGESARLPTGDEDWDTKDKKFKVNPEKKAKREREAMTIQKLLARVEALEAEFKTLKEGKTNA